MYRWTMTQTSQLEFKHTKTLEVVGAADAVASWDVNMWCTLPVCCKETAWAVHTDVESFGLRWMYNSSQYKLPQQRRYRPYFLQYLSSFSSATWSPLHLTVALTFPSFSLFSLVCHLYLSVCAGWPRLFASRVPYYKYDNSIRTNKGGGRTHEEKTKCDSPHISLCWVLFLLFVGSNNTEH